MPTEKAHLERRLVILRRRLSWWPIDESLDCRWEWERVVLDIGLVEQQLRRLRESADDLEAPAIGGLMIDHQQRRFRSLVIRKKVLPKGSPEYRKVEKDAYLTRRLIDRLWEQQER
jgi:hypothetical protein